MPNLLLFSNSTNFGEPYLEFTLTYINKFLNGGYNNCLFIPFAAVSFSYDEYESKVVDKFDSMGIKVTSIHRYKDKIEAINNSEVIVVGGGNSFKLIYEIYRFGLIDPIRKRVGEGVPYIGWSAGSNIACPSICTTNDMPIIQPISFDALGLVPFQINPHYTDATIPNHGGESRDARIEEFLQLNSGKKVIGLPEGSLIQCLGNEVKLLGSTGATIFEYNAGKREITSGSNLQFLFNC